MSWLGKVPKTYRRVGIQNWRLPDAKLPVLVLPPHPISERQQLNLKDKRVLDCFPPQPSRRDLVDSHLNTI